MRPAEVECERLRATLAAIEALLSTVEPAYDAEGRFLGAVGGPEHRTVGRRAWCFRTTEWCYPTAFCSACDPMIDPWSIRDALGLFGEIA